MRIRMRAEAIVCACDFNYKIKYVEDLKPAGTADYVRLFRRGMPSRHSFRTQPELRWARKGINNRRADLGPSGTESLPDRPKLAMECTVERRVIAESAPSSNLRSGERDSLRIGRSE
jgi:hypothetical protein